jgi:glycosyltransferase involved in cell wall biosynthesis
VPALLQQRLTDAVLFLDWADWWGRGGTIVERSGRAMQLLFGPFETWLEESFRSRATANTTISAALRERCVGLGVPVERVAVLPNGCETPVLADRARARATLRVNDDPLVVHLGVMQRLDAALLFAAFRLLLQELPTARLVLVGGYRGPVPQDLARAVIRTGYVDRGTLAQWLGAADVGAIPLRDTIAGRGRWPGKVNEYLTAGLPVVLPRVGAAAEYVADAGAGIVCAAEPGAMARALATALTADEAARARMGEACHALAAGALAWERIGAELIDFYATWLRRDATRQVTTTLNPTAS